jgi:hypothetical protein
VVLCYRCTNRFWRSVSFLFLQRLMDLNGKGYLLILADFGFFLMEKGF